MIEGREVVSRRGAVAADPPEAARIGSRVLAAGGNAMDAIAAAGIAGCMLAPAAAGIGGYVGCAVVLSGDGQGQRVWSVDSNAVAPASAHDHMFEVISLGSPAERLEDTRAMQSNGTNEKEYACRVRDDANVVGPLAVAVPGVMGCIGTLWERWGRLEWRQIVEPSRELLENGLQLAGPDGLRHRPEMAETLGHIAEAGWQDFYRGELARKIADGVQGAGGILTRDDMAAFEPRVTEPYGSSYRDSSVHCAILPNGGLTCLQILNMMECFDPPPVGSVEYWHLVAEVLKLAWRDRLRHLGDPDFVSVPVRRLLSKDYAAGRVESIRQFPRHVDMLIPPRAQEHEHGTFHFSSADAEGNLVSMTLSHGGGFGSKFVVRGTGIVLGHGMCRFDPRPGRPNSIAGGKRPLNNTCPVLVRLPDRDIAAGLPGGRRLVSVAAQIVQRMVDFGASAYEAAESPRLHVGAHEPLELMESVGSPILDGIGEIGHTVRKVRAVAGAAHCAEVLRGKALVRAGGNGWAAGVA